MRACVPPRRSVESALDNYFAIIYRDVFGAGAEVGASLFLLWFLRREQPSVEPYITSPAVNIQSAGELIKIDHSQTASFVPKLCSAFINHSPFKITHRVAWQVRSETPNRGRETAAALSRLLETRGMSTNCHQLLSDLLSFSLRIIFLLLCLFVLMSYKPLYSLLCALVNHCNVMYL